MHDPFPSEELEVNFATPETYADLVYRGCRYEEGNSPNMLYIPSAKVLFKIMRASIGVSKIEDFWIN